MRSAAIQVVRPNVTQKEAVKAFRASGVRTLVWQLQNGPLRRIAEAYVPFWMYRVRYEVGRAAQTRLFAMDAVSGSLDLFEFPRVPSGEQLVELETRNRLECSLSDDQAEELLREKVLRLVFQQGFFKLRGVKPEIVRESTEIHLPYWLGFYGNGEAAKCRVLDAVRRRIEGAKASAFFEQWLAA
jgi:hypothetical protein